LLIFLCCSSDQNTLMITNFELLKYINNIKNILKISIQYINILMHSRGKEKPQYEIENDCQDRK